MPLFKTLFDLRLISHVLVLFCFVFGFGFTISSQFVNYFFNTFEIYEKELEAMFFFGFSFIFRLFWICSF